MDHTRNGASRKRVTRLSCLSCRVFPDELGAPPIGRTDPRDLHAQKSSFNMCKTNISISSGMGHTAGKNVHGNLLHVTHMRAAWQSLDGQHVLVSFAGSKVAHHQTRPVVMVMARNDSLEL